MPKEICRWWILAMTVMLVFVWRPGGAYALDCAPNNDITAAYEDYDGIVVAKVEGTKFSFVPTTDTKVQLTVERSFKGIQQEKLEMWEDGNWGYIGIPETEGKRYLIFLNKTAGGWEHPLCSPTREASHADEMLAYLADYELPITEKGTGGQLNWLLYIGGGLILVLVAGVIIRLRRRRR